MALPLQEIQGKHVVALKEGRDLGAVDEVYVDTGKKKVAGMLVRESRFDGSPRWLEAGRIETLGEDYLLVPRASDVKVKKPRGRRLKDLAGVPVITKAGRNLGVLVDVQIDSDWTISEIQLSGKRVLSIEPRKAVFGSDTILLREGAEKSLRSTKNQKPGVMARLFGEQTVEDTAELLSRAEKAVRSVGKSESGESGKRGAKAKSQKGKKASKKKASKTKASKKKSSKKKSSKGKKSSKDK